MTTALEQWALARETSLEIARAIHQLYPEGTQAVWDFATDEQESEVLDRAWELADEDLLELDWGGCSFRRDRDNN